MTGPVLLVLRILLIASLYCFLAWAMVTLWRDLRVNSQLISAPTIPPITLTRDPKPDGQTGEPRVLGQAEVVIGRSSKSDYPIVDDTVSARHARLSYHHNQWWVEDLRSTNGTSLNDERVAVPTVIVSGDDLRCGQVNMVIGINE